MIGTSPVGRSRRHTSRPSMPGQHQVEHDQVGGRLAHEPQRRLAVGGLDHLVPVGAEVGHHDLAHGRVVVDDQHARQGRHLPPVAAGPHAASPATTPDDSTSAASAQPARRGRGGRAASGCRRGRRTGPAPAPRHGHASPHDQADRGRGARRRREQPRAEQAASPSTSGGSTASCDDHPAASHDRRPRASSAGPGATAAGTRRTAAASDADGAERDPGPHDVTSSRATHLVCSTPGRFGAISRHG